MPSAISISEISGQPRQERVGAAIRHASARTGVDFTYLMNQARLESGLNPTARARTSSATGLFQFIDQTWLATVSRHGADHGLGWAAGAIVRGGDGRFSVPDPALRRQILDLRNDPVTASVMAAEFADDNRAVLEQRLGRRAEPVDLYLAHFLGAGGASQFLSAHAANPDAPAAPLLPAAARANRSIFYDSRGGARSLGEIRDRFAARMDGAVPPAASPPRRQPALEAGEFVPLRRAALPAADPATLLRPSPEYARLAYMMLAELGQ